MSEVSLDEVYSELMDLKKELALIKHVLIPEETVSKQELEEINRIKKRMEKGERIRLEELLAKD
jgi:uncharacterized coiled-coil DUF342 family protein